MYIKGVSAEGVDVRYGGGCGIAVHDVRGTAEVCPAVPAAVVLLRLVFEALRDVATALRVEPGQHWNCDRYTSQPEKLAYCTVWPARRVDLVVHAGVFAVDVAVGGGRHGGVVERGGEDAALLFGPACDFDLRELFVPCGSGAGGYLVICGGGCRFGFEIGTGIGFADVGDADAQVDFAACAEAQPDAGAVAGFGKPSGPKPVPPSDAVAPDMTISSFHAPVSVKGRSKRATK